MGEFSHLPRTTHGCHLLNTFCAPHVTLLPPHNCLKRKFH